MLLPIVRQALDEIGWQHDLTPDGAACLAHVQGTHTAFRALLVPDDALEQVGVLLFPATHVPPAARAAACEYVVRVNQGLRLGAFDLDLSDGEWRFRHCIDVEGGALTPAMVRVAIGLACATLEAYHDGMLRIAFGGVPPERAAAEALAGLHGDADGSSAGTADGACTTTGAAPDIDAILADLLAEGPDATPTPAERASTGGSTTPEGDTTAGAARPIHRPDDAVRHTMECSPRADTSDADRSDVPPLPIANAYRVPGTRLVAGEYPGSPPSNPTRDLEAKLGACLDAGITVFVDLTGAPDPLAPYAPTLTALAERRGVQVTHERLTIRDMGVCDEAHMCRVLDTIDHHLAAGRTVYVHCWGGVGRTGTVVGCWLVRHGHTGEEALATVGRLFATMSEAKVRRHAQTGSPQTKAQREMVRSWGEGVMVRRTTADARRAASRRRARASEPAAEHSATAMPVNTPIAERPPLVDASADEARTHARAHPSRMAADARRVHTRIRGCLLGGALGDALGWPVEFLSLERIRERYGPDGIQELDARADGGLGAITDDTQLTLFTAEGLLRSTTRHMEYWAYSEPDGRDWAGVHTYHSDVMRHAYLRWLHTQDAGPRGRELGFVLGYPGWLFGVRALHSRRAPGSTCLGALRAHASGSYTSNDSKGCGGVMRVAPIGLVPTDDAFGYAADAARLTHGHPSGYLSAGAYAHIVHALLWRDLSLADAVRDVLPRLAREPGHEETTTALSRALDLARPGREPTAERVAALGQGWTGEEALAIGVYCALVAEDFAHGVRLAVNHSGDSDSTGSIAGALLGVECGEHGLPASWLDALQLRDVIARVADDLLIGYGGGDGWRTRYPGN